MKRVLHISKYYYPFSGGTEQIARDVVLALKGDYEQKVIAFNDGKEDKVDIVDFQSQRNWIAYFHGQKNCQKK